MKLYKTLEKNVEKVKKCISSDDVIFHNLTIKNKKACLIFAGDIVDKTAIGELVLRPLENIKGKFTEKNLLSAFYSPEKQIVEEADDIVREIVSGNSVLLVDGFAKAISFGLKKFEKRAFKRLTNGEFRGKIILVVIRKGDIMPFCVLFCG